jgi:hypothetical protein
MSGRNETKIVNGLHNMHTNFTIDQCKNQWIILTAPNGVVRDSIFVQKTQENHTRGRLNGVNEDFQTVGIQGWRVYTAPTFSAINNLPPYLDYAPKPLFTEPSGIGSVTTPSFEIYHTFFGAPIDTSCFEVWFTTDGSTPSPSNGVQYIDPATPLIPPPTQLTMFRAVTYPKSTATVVPAVPPTYCELNYLPSFIETNTYFINVTHQIPVVSVCGTQLATLFGGSWGISPVGVMEYFESDGSFIEEVVGDFNKHGNDSWAYPQRGVDFVGRDEAGYNEALNHQLFIRKHDVYGLKVIKLDRIITNMFTKEFIIAVVFFQISQFQIVIYQTIFKFSPSNILAFCSTTAIKDIRLNTTEIQMII